MTGATSPLEISRRPVGRPLRVPEANDDRAWLRNVRLDVNRFEPFKFIPDLSAPRFGMQPRDFSGAIRRTRD